jgi:uroporphyrinogen decarboxylase
MAASLEDAITTQAYDAWVKYRGITEGDDIPLYNIFYEAAGFTQIPGNVLDEFKVDTRGFLIGQPEEIDAEITFEDDGKTMVFFDEWGIKWAKPETSLYIDPVDFPFKEKLDEETVELVKSKIPNPHDAGRYKGLEEEAKRCAASGCAVVVSTYGLGLWDYGHLMRGIENALMDLVINQKAFDSLVGIISDWQVAIWEKTLDTVGDHVDIVMHSDDLGEQTGPMFSPEIYRKVFKPHHKRLFDVMKSRGHKLLLHSCGSIRRLIPDLIEVGVDILNPIQVTATGMDTKELKKEFGSELCFWGGGVDTQHILPRGTVQEVKDEVKRRIDDLAPGGGFVFTPVHNIQADVPAENLQAMWETLMEYGKY